MKAKKAILALLMASPLMLTACPDNGGTVSGNNGGGTAIPLPGAEPRLPSLKPIAFFNGLQRSEALLQQKYWFTSQIVGDNITYSDLGKIFRNGLTSFELLARLQGRTVAAVKISFYDDIYAFAQNLEVLKIRELELRAYSKDLYDDYFKKTSTLGEIFITKRAKVYSRVLGLREKRLNRIGIQDINVIDRGVLDINIISADGNKLSRQSKTRILAAVKKASLTCDALNTMLNDQNFKVHLEGLNIRSCSSSPVVEAVSKLRNLDGLSKRNIIAKINQSPLTKLEALNTVADSFLAANSIALKAKNASGINNKARKNWELDIISQNPGVRRRKLEKAMDNNLYDNIIFKKSILEAISVLGAKVSREKNAKIKRELLAISKVLVGARYHDINISVGSSAVVDGIGTDPGPIVIDESGFDSEREPDIIIEDLEDLDDLDKPAPPVKTPAPKVGGGSRGTPPTPPKTIRRP